MSRQIPWRQVHHHWEIYFLGLPTFILVALFQYYPAASGIFHSFYRWNGSDISEFVGLANYTDLLGSTAFWQSFNVALTLGLWNVAKMIPAIAVAVWIHRCRSTKWQFVYRLLFVIPMVIPTLVVALIWRSFFFEAISGYLNQFLNITGLFTLLCRLDQWLAWGGIFVQGAKPAWLGDPRLILTACIVWGFPWVGSFAVLTHLAKLQNIPKELYEAGEIDGTNWWNKFTQIELPLMMGSIYLMLVFVIIGTIKDAGMILALAGLEGGPGGVVTVPALFMLRKAFVGQEMGAACAVGIILTLVVMMLQKISEFALQEPSLRGRFHSILPWFCGLLGIFLVASSFSLLPGLCLLGLALPWGVFARFIQRMGLFNGTLLHVQPVPALNNKPIIKSRLSMDLPLRSFKHAAIWCILIFAFLPLYLMLVVSIKDNSQFYAAPATLTSPAHWENWQFAFELIMPSVANSLYIALSSTGLALFAGLGAAYFFARNRLPLSSFFWNALLIMMMMPAIANLAPLFRLLADLNLLNTMTALILVGSAGGQAFAIFVLRNFVSEIPRDLFEAAEIDGAGHFQQMRYVVLPLCGPILGTVGVMHFISEWNEFIMPLIVMRDSANLPVMVQLLRLAGEYVKFWGPLMAGYAIASLPVIFLFSFSMKLFTRGLTEGAVKG
ncbi:MAG: ABC transporter permease subunit [Candidatus Methylacidiphilales bacterium]|nr:ABC transporter permease subunit [Candidatus Methylacidiphilales bacterium]